MPNWRAVVVKVPAPAETLAVPRAVVEPLLVTLRFTIPEADDGVTVIVKVSLCPWTMVAAERKSEVVLAVRSSPHAVVRFFASTEPRPFTRL